MGGAVKISVCLPTYNGAEFVAAAVESVLAQSLGEWELLVVDDGSTDATVEVVSRFQDSRIQIYTHVERLGIPGNWNRALAVARGEYICVFHQDDEMVEENLEQKVAVLASDTRISFVHSGAEVVVEGSAPTVLGNWIEDAGADFIEEGERYFRKLLLQGNLICAPTVVARRQSLLDLGGFNEELGFTPDYEMWMKLCIGSRVAFLAQPLIRYRWHGQNASHAYRFERGVEETLLARRRALHYYLEHTGQQEEGGVLQDALDFVAKRQRWTAELEHGKAWLEEQRASWQRVAEEREKMMQEQQAWVEKLEEGKVWLEEQRASWQRVAEEREKMMQEQQAWVEKLEESRVWLEEQRASWQRVAEEREKMMQEQQTWIEKLEESKVWLEEQRDNWQRIAEEREKMMQEQQT